MGKSNKNRNKHRYLNFLMGIDALIDIRNDFFDVYLTSLVKSKTKKRVTSECDYWYSKAIEKGAYSESYNPHEQLIKKFVYIQWLWRIIGVLAIVASFQQHPLYIAFAPLPVFLEVSTIFLSKNTALTQYINKNIKYSILELQKFKRINQYHICSAYIWNNSLMHNKTIAMLQMFRIFKLILPNSFYKKIINGLKINTPFYLDHNKTLNGSPAHREYLRSKWQFKKILKKQFKKLSSIFSNFRNN